MRSRAGMLLWIVLMAAAGCARHSSPPRPASTLTEAQRDSALARSSLPGAGTVGRALEQSGQATDRNAQLDSLPH